MNIITGYRDEPHVTSQQDRDTNIGIFGSGVHILNIGSKMAATVISANEVQIADGLMVAEGCTAEIPRGTTESMTIENGAQDMLRKDLIVARYTRNSGTGVEGMALVVIKGTSASANPARPEHTSGSIADGDTLVEFPLYEVNISGITITSVVLLAGTSQIDDVVTKMGSGTLATVAQTVIAAINELRTSIVNAVSRIATVETKTAGIVRTSAFSLAAGRTDYKQLSQVATYLLIVDSAYPSDTMKGLYLIGVSGDNQISIKAVSTASAVAITDAGNALLMVKNNGNAYIRYTLVTTYSG